MFTNAIVAAALTFTAFVGGTAGVDNGPLEDEAGFSCATMGNHICGPNNDEGAPAGLYLDGQLIQPWTNYDAPENDPLYGVFPGSEYDQIEEGLEAEDEFGGIPGGAVCGTDAQCADWSRAHGEVPTGYAAGK